MVSLSPVVIVADINIMAMDENALITPVVNVDVSDVDVTISANAVISGRDVFLLASADNRRLFAEDWSLQKDDVNGGDILAWIGEIFEGVVHLAKTGDGVRLVRHGGSP